MILLTAMRTYGAPWDVIPTLPAEERTWDAGKGIFMVMSWMFIGCWTFVDPGFHQRIAATTSEAVARRGVLLAVLFWICFDTLTTLTAMYATLALGDTVAKGTELFPMFGDALLPAGMKGVFFAGMCGAIIAAVIGYTFVSGTTMGRDFFAKLKRTSDEGTITTYTRFGVAAASLVGIVLAIAVDSVVSLWWSVANLVIPGLLVPVVGAYVLNRPPSRGTAIACLIVPTAVSGVWTIWKSQGAELESRLFGIESIGDYQILTPIIVGIGVALAIWGIGSVVNRNSDNERRSSHA
jgi:SSS family solute:Na+ symporter